MMQDDNAQPHFGRLTTEKFEKMEWYFLLRRLRYGPYLTFDYHIFGFVKDQIRGQRYETMEDLQKVVSQRFC